MATSLRERSKETLASARLELDLQHVTSLSPSGDTMQDVSLALVPLTLAQELPLVSYRNIPTDINPMTQGEEIRKQSHSAVILKDVPSLWG